jgi:hypothetical protein
MDSILIEVAIGLVLVFALTSLLTTALQEVYSSSTKMRGRVLRQAIVSFVGDDSRLAQALLDHPLLVSLSPQKQDAQAERLPSWIESDTLVAALLGHLVDTHAGGQKPETPGELVQRIQAVASGSVQPGTALAPVVGTRLLGNAEAALPNALFVRGVTALVQGVERDWPSFEKRLVAWYDAVGARSTGWFKRRTQLGAFFIGFGVAAVLNINPIVIGAQLWVDEPLRKSLVAAAQKVDAESGAKEPTPRKETSAAPAAVGAAAQAQEQAPTPAAAASAAMGRLTLALRAQATAALDNPAEEKALGPLTERYVELEKAMQDWQTAGAQAGQATARRLDELARGLVAAVPARPELAAVLETAQQLAAATQGLATLTPTPTPTTAKAKGICAGSDLTPDILAVCERYQSLAKLQQLGLPIGWSGSAQMSFYRSACNAPAPCDEAWRQWADWGLMLCGWVLMGLACTLGAPFWFDALSKFIRLRGSGERAGTTPAPAGTGAAPAGMLAGPAPSTALPASSPADGAIAMSDALNDGERALTPAEVQRVQRGVGMQEVEASGWFDGPTRRSIKAWQERGQWLPATGELSAWQIRQLLEMQPTAKTPPGAGHAAASTSTPATPAAPATAANAHEDDHADGCDVDIGDPTEDEALPRARGGVQANEED